MGVKLYRYRNLVLRQWWILALTIGIGLAYQGWVVSQKPRAFQSTSQIMIKEELSGGPDGIIKTSGVDNFIGTQMAMMKSATVMDNARTIVSMDPRGLTGSIPEIAVSMIPKTQIFVVNGTGPDPEYTRAYVDALVRAFVDYRLGVKSDYQHEMGSDLDEKVKKMKEEVAAAEEKLRAYTTANKMPFWNNQYLTALKFLSERKSYQIGIQTELNRLTTIAPDQLLAHPSRRRSRTPAPSIPRRPAATLRPPAISPSDRSSTTSISSGPGT